MNDQICTNIFRSIGNFALQSENALHLINIGACEELVNTLKRSNITESEFRAASWAVSILAKSSCCHVKLLHAGTCEVLMSLLIQNKKVMEAVENCCWAISRMSDNNTIVTKLNENKN